ncbi:sugar transferase [Kocuria rhizophila]|uniref:sugar transferase n=1 Tax=Kocuria rhizophila TaxID=72000 RepID=UPI003D681A92
MVLANVVRFDGSTTATVVGLDWLTYPAISALIGLSWVFALVVSRAYSVHRLGFGEEEYRAVAHATFVLFGGLSMVAVLFRLDVARGFLAVALPLGTVLLYTGRWLLRRALARSRRAGSMLEDSLLIGSHRAVAWTAERIRRIPAAGYRVSAVVCAEPDAPDVVELSDGTQLPNMKHWDRIMDVVERSGLRTVIVADDTPADRQFLRQLSWQIEGSDIQLVLTSRLTDVAGPRIHWRPVEGLPLMTVDTPQFSGAKYVLKRSFDFVAAGIGILLTLPVLALTALAVKLEDGGPVLYRQERVGIDGSTFTMFKFRSMRVGADAELARLIAENQAAPPLFKIENDPRVTRVGKVIRAWSVDELPQLFNVLRGDMAVVGPRPQLPDEVARLPQHVLRRLKVKPGITGPWQVGGRSSLSAEESTRLDLSYVENWSIVGDAIIVLKTVKAVLTRDGAY